MSQSVDSDLTAGKNDIMENNLQIMPTAKKVITLPPVQLEKLKYNVSPVLTYCVAMCQYVRPCAPTLTFCSYSCCDQCSHKFWFGSPVPFGFRVKPWPGWTERRTEPIVQPTMMAAQQYSEYVTTLKNVF